MFVIFRNDLEDRLININQINSIWKEKLANSQAFVLNISEVGLDLIR